MEHKIVGSHPDVAREFSLQECYALSTGKQFTDASKNCSAFIFRVMACQAEGLRGFLDIRHSKMLT